MNPKFVDGLLRSWGGVKNFRLCFDVKQPVILPAGLRVVDLFYIVACSGGTVRGKSRVELHWKLILELEQKSGVGTNNPWVYAMSEAHVRN